MIDLLIEELSQGLIAEMIPMQRQYWEEVAGPFHNFPPDVDWPTYLLAQQTGRLKVICGRADGALKAGAFIVITPHPHYACIAASLPLLFVHPDFRKSRLGFALVKMAEEEAAKAGAQVLFTHGGVHNGVARLFEALHYSDYGRYFFKTIGDNEEPVFKVAL